MMRSLDSVIVLADISGYTRFVVMHRSSLLHAEQIVSELLETVTKNATYPLKIQKLEGDAAFLTAEIDGPAVKVLNDVARQIVAFMTAFKEKKKSLFDKSIGGCMCSACQSIEDLCLKTILHVGTILEKEISGLTELAGEPVIVAHRLLKNSMKDDAYILATDEAASLLNFEPYAKSRNFSEKIEDVGVVKVTAYLPPKSSLDRCGIKTLTRPVGALETVRLSVTRLLSRLRGVKRNFRNFPS